VSGWFCSPGRIVVLAVCWKMAVIRPAAADSFIFRQRAIGENRLDDNESVLA
jgi:hypothetical protein